MLDGKAVKEVAADVLQKGGGTRDKVRYAGLQLPDLIIRVTADVHQLVFSVLRVLDILYRHYAKKKLLIDIFILHLQLNTHLIVQNIRNM